MQYRIIIFFILIFQITFISCGYDEEELYEPQLNVCCFLQGYQRPRCVIVDRSYSMDEPSEGFIPDAQVIMRGKWFVDTFAFSDFDGAYHSTNPFSNIYPESTYSLTVFRQDFDTVFAQTCVPGDFTIRFPQPGDTVTRTDTLVWTKSTGARYYYGYFVDWHQTGYHFWHIPDTTDTLVRMPIPYYLYDLLSGHYTIQIQAADVNYLNYSQFDENTDSLLQAGVEGGIGVFGSFVSHDVPAYFLTE